MCGSNLGIGDLDTIARINQECNDLGLDTIEVVFDGWCWGKHNDKENEVCVTIDRAPEERPKGG